jgi:hypothetical protein
LWKVREGIPFSQWTDIAPVAKRPAPTVKRIREPRGLEAI